MSVHYKGDRVLSLYLRMAAGGTIHKENYCLEEDVTSRTFERDMQTLRNCLSEQYLYETVVYDKLQGTYSMERAPQPKELTFVESYLLFKVLFHQRLLREDELTGLADSILSLSGASNQQTLREMLGAAMTQYEPPDHGQAIMKIMGDLLLVIGKGQKVRLSYRIKRNTREVTVCPLSLEYGKGTFYLIADVTGKGGALFDVSAIQSFIPLAEYFLQNQRLKEIKNTIATAVRQETEKKYKYEELIKNGKA